MCAAVIAKHPVYLTGPMYKGGKGDKSNNTSDRIQNGQPEEVYQRYYHLYRQGELGEDVSAAGGIVLESGYEKDNWWAIVQNMEQG